MHAHRNSSYFIAVFIYPHKPRNNNYFLSHVRIYKFLFVLFVLCFIVDRSNHISNWSLRKTKSLLLIKINEWEGILFFLLPQTIESHANELKMLKCMRWMHEIMYSHFVETMNYTWMKRLLIIDSEIYKEKLMIGTSNGLALKKSN